MNYSLFALFVGLSFINVVLHTLCSLLTITGTKRTAAIICAVTYGVYTVVIVYTACDLPLWLKVVITAATNYIGVYISKWIVDKLSKDKLWKIELAVKRKYSAPLTAELKNIPYNCVNVGDWAMFNCYCSTQSQSQIVKDLCKKYNGKISAYESKSL